jgi:hypothetical protein
MKYQLILAKLVSVIPSIGMFLCMFWVLFNLSCAFSGLCFKGRQLRGSESLVSAANFLLGSSWLVSEMSAKP